MTSRFTSTSWKRSYCSYKQTISSKSVRSRFIDYFVKEKDHVFLKSAPVASHFDPSIPFINAGMCQFKRVFTGEEKIDCARAVNTQKCIRIGGKHNDLNLVGVDSYHHTFFEMLGNWSFGAYDKKEACAMAWNLLTSPPYNVTLNKLFVTYFGGNEEMNLPADEEVRDIWLELGVPADRILPFGISENFWEMGHSGPCGTCTEIHVALTDDMCSRSDLVNKNNPLLAELWNIVFIKFNKTDNSIVKLPKEYIDTGMGLERLTTLLQNKTSNYDTDFFVPLFDTITRISGAPKYSGSFSSNQLDTSYRCLADFSRMITFAICDDIFPDINPKLRRVLRKALYLAENKFECKPASLLNELSNQVAEMYHEVFPEVGNNLQKVKLVVENEDKMIQKLMRENFQKWNSLKLKYPILDSFSFIEYPGLAAAYDYVCLSTNSLKPGDYVPVKVIHYLFDTHGLDQPIIERLMNKLEFKVDWNEFEEFLSGVKDTSRISSLKPNNFFNALREAGIETDVLSKQSITKNNGSYHFPDIKTRLVAVIQKDSILSELDIPDELVSKYSAEVTIEDDEIALIFDKSNFFAGERGQISDKGEVTILSGDENICYDILRAQNLNNIVVHFAKPRDNQCKKIPNIGSISMLKIDPDHRIDLMRRFTAIHLVLLAVRNLYPLIYLKTCLLLPDCFKITCRALGRKFNFNDDKTFIEEKVNEYISRALPIERIMVPTAREALSLPKIIFAPGVLYPASDIHAITIYDENGQVISCEACSHLHLSSTEDVGKFQIVEIKMKTSLDLAITARVGKYIRGLSELEEDLENNSKNFAYRGKVLLNNDEITLKEIVDFNDEMLMYYYKMMHDLSETNALFTAHSKNCISTFHCLKQDLRKKLEKFSRQSVIREFSSRMQQKAANQKFVTFFCLLEFKWFTNESFKVDLIYQNKFPTMLFHFTNNRVSVISYVPQSHVTDDFNAAVWLKLVAQNFNFKISEEDDMDNFCFLKHRIPDKNIYNYINELTKTSADVAAQFLK